MALKSYKEEFKERFDLIVVGGGLAGICAAISAARQKKKVVLVQDRPVLGGNSSSEIRVPPGGAGGRGGWARETGIIEEIMVNDRARNHDPYLEGTMNSMWDLNLYEFVRAEKNITLYLNSIVTAVEMKDKGTIKSVAGIQSISEKRFKFYGKYFIDCTGDGVVGALAGAEFRYGREARKEFGESLAPLKADNKTQGNSLMYRAYDVGYPVKFTPPSWYEDYKKEGSLYKRSVEIFPRKINNRTEYCGHWWIEVGVPFLTIEDNDKIGKEIIRHQIGVWDYIKNSGKYDADNFVLEWMGMLPGKRESRRLVGDYILKEQDIVEQKKFSDRIAFGGWFLDVHTMGGILAKDEPPEGLAGDEDLAPKLKTSLYSIPFKSIYSKNIENLLMAGRNISVTHAALGSTRVMLTCALLGQAAGTAASMCLTKKASPRILAEKHIYQLQQQLVKDDCFIYDISTVQ
ncbi:MAG: FAD-dependent oxidoreductase [Candidatus Ratteibacteria bacterium]